jgi:hypothetical protein
MLLVERLRHAAALAYGPPFFRDISLMRAPQCFVENQSQPEDLPKQIMRAKRRLNDLGGKLGTPTKSQSRLPSAAR